MFAILSGDATFFEVGVFLLLGPLGGDFDLPICPSDFQKPWFYGKKMILIINIRLGFGCVLPDGSGLSWRSVGCFSGLLAGALLLHFF